MAREERNREGNKQLRQRTREINQLLDENTRLALQLKEAEENAEGLVATVTKLQGEKAEASAGASVGAGEMPISVFVRSRPMLPDELRSGGFDVVTPFATDVSTSLVVHEPKTLVDLSKAMDNHTYRFDGGTRPPSD